MEHISNFYNGRRQDLSRFVAGRKHVEVTLWYLLTCFLILVMYVIAALAGR